MRGLAFPSNAVFDREASYEYGTPFGNVDDIPIDPALGGPAIDPALMEEGAAVNDVQVQPETLQPHLTSSDIYAQVRQYSQGPQGDPFAPQPPPVYFPVETDQLVSPAKPAKRKRRPRREEECGFCQGNDSRNRTGEPEVMVTCDECGRSGHPSCMELSEVGDVVRSYPWKCLECKTCEICLEKGDDERILFCDCCDRGWHMDCLIPPIEAPPQGRWHCPMCPPPTNFEPHSEVEAEDAEQACTPSIRESSIGSSRRSFVIATPTRSTHRGKGKGKAVAFSTDESDSEVEVEAVETPIVRRGRGRPKSSKKVKGRGSRTDEVTDEEHAATPSRLPKRSRLRLHSPIAPPLPRVRLRLPPQNGKGKEREDDEPPKGLFDDILSVDDRDTTKTTILNSDKQHFERSRVLAEQKSAPPPALPPPLPPWMSEAPDPSTPGPSRPLRSSTFHQLPPIATLTPGLSASPGPSTPSEIHPKTGPPALRINTIRFGQFDIKTWYDAPFPEEYASIPDGRLYVCEFCLKYIKSRFGAVRHRMKCKARHPPGDEIYRDGAVSIFEVDGRKNKIYCQNLCLLSKMFLDHKSLFYDVEPFLFYVMTEVDEYGARFVGYFSKEKRSPKDFNVSCIMTLPVRQRQGWGNLLIDFSYLLSKKEQRLGSPEKPLSGLGALGYRNYWTLALMRYLETAPDQPRLEDIGAATSMTIEDIYNTLVQQDMISTREPTPPPVKPIPGQSIKFPKGRKNGIARRTLQRTQTIEKDPETPKGPFSAPKHYEIRWDRDKVAKFLRTWEGKGYLRLRPEKLQWSPYLLTRNKVDMPVPAEPSISATPSGQAPPSGDGGFVNRSPTPNGRIRERSVKLLGVDPPDKLFIPPSRTIRHIRSPEKSVAEVGPDVVYMSEEVPPLVSKRRPRSQSRQLSNISTPKRKTPVGDLRSTRVTRRSRTEHRLDAAGEDEAFAVKLALEEQRQGRHLRSRTGEPGQEHKRASPASSTSLITTKSRKRRRVDSSPEVEESSPPLSSAGSDVKEPHKTEPRQSNGYSIPELPKIARASAPEPVPMVDDTPEPAHIDVVKSEDLGTPLTSVTSRQSDTVLGTDPTLEGKSVAVEEGDEDGEGEEDGDADADGEYEEDAEGELDVEL